MKPLVVKPILAAASFAILAVAATPSFALTKADQVGEPGIPEMADRTLHLTSQTRYLNVHSGETVELDVNGRHLTWKFDGLARVVNLQDIAAGAPDVKVYVTELTDD
jgi:hypothetical protein